MLEKQLLPPTFGLMVFRLTIKLVTAFYD